MGMISTFVSALVGFLICLCIVASGVWDNGLTSTALTISAFNTLLGSYGGWVVSFLSISFGMGVLVAYAYITRAAFLYVTHGNFGWLFPFIYCGFSGFAAVMEVNLIWIIAQYLNAIMLIINLFGIAYLMPRMATYINESLRKR
jgi:AGCS family alanine or glycine:cation symporter